ncbi:MAG: KTSC domain-containing protein [Xanthobacteraceae bacterium]|nr:KTSC domain-containing protein [Xanthobacteraceae bacterium]
MNRVPVRSSNIESVGYDAASETLEVQFRSSGGIYQYGAVPAATHARFMSAPSKGKFFDQYIRNKFRTTKVG